MEDTYQIKSKINLLPEDKIALGHINYAQGLGASLRYANELRAIQQTGRLFIKSSKLHEDVLRGNLGPGPDMFEKKEDTGPFNNLYQFSLNKDW